MKLKCHECDEKTIKELKKQGNHLDENGKKIVVKSINTDTDDYLKINVRYYHEECFRKKLTSSKKYDSHEIESIINNHKLEFRKARMLTESRDKFYQWIKDHYKVALPAYYCMRVDKIAKGEDEKVYGSISYDEFLDMYTMLIHYLAKQTMGKQFKNIAQRMNYELAIVIGQYENYINHKNRLAEREVEKVNIKEKISYSEKFSIASQKVRSSSDEFRVADIHDELI